MPSPPRGTRSRPATPTPRSSSSVRRRRCCRSRARPAASTRDLGGARRRARLVVHLTDRRGVDHHGELPRRHRHRPDRSRPPLDGRPRLPRRPGRRCDRGDGAPARDRRGCPARRGRRRTLTRGTAGRCTGKRRIPGEPGILLRAPDRNRTCDLWYRKPTLYPLSYGGVPIETIIPATRPFHAVERRNRPPA